MYLDVTKVYKLRDYPTLGPRSRLRTAEAVEVVEEEGGTGAFPLTREPRGLRTGKVNIG